ncbi:13978_t:CDS:2, partial [Dentiscutata erythropus]
MTASDEFELLNLAEYKVALICLLKRDDLELEEIDYLIKWSIANSKKLHDDNISDLSDEDSWSDNQFEMPYSNETSDSFIFSFTDPSNPILRPCFGADLCMDFNCWSYAHADYYYKITNLSQLTVDEYEVFTVDNFNQSINAVLKTTMKL